MKPKGRMILRVTNAESGVSSISEQARATRPPGGTPIVTPAHGRKKP